MSTHAGETVKEYIQQVADSISDLRNEEFKDYDPEARILASSILQRLVVDEMYVHGKEKKPKIDNYA